MTYQLFNYGNKTPLREATEQDLQDFADGKLRKLCQYVAAIRTPEEHANARRIERDWGPENDFDCCK